MIINVHAGHNPDGKVACGAVGLIKESTEARNVAAKVIALLRAEGHTVYDCTVDNGTSQNDVLKKIVAKCNAHAADLDVSIHFNAGRGDYKGDGSIGGTEVLVYKKTSKSYDEAERICKKIASLGFRNRGVKTSTSLYVLKKTSAPALLIECCFVDDADDIKLYNAATMAKAIVEGILNKTVSTEAPKQDTAESGSTVKAVPFKVKTKTTLNIRAGAGTKFKVNGVAPVGTYTITEVSGSWGKLKSGAGWISISTKYVDYI